MWPRLYRQNFSLSMPRWQFPWRHPVLQHAKTQGWQGSRCYPLVLEWPRMCVCRENHMSSWAKRNIISSWCYQKKRNRCCIVFPSRAKAFFPIFDSLESILTSICGMLLIMAHYFAGILTYDSCCWIAVFRVWKWLPSSPADWHRI